MIPLRKKWGRSSSLIEDVVMPHAKKFTDPNNEVVQRRSIGNLQRQYLRSRNKQGIPLDYQSSSQGSGVAVKIHPRQRYTVVPPLQKLHPASDSLPGLSVASVMLLATPIAAASWLGHRLFAVLAGLGRAAAAGWHRLSGGLSKRLPKRYTAADGVSPDWQLAAWRARYALPILLVAFLLSLFIVGFLNNPKHQPNTNTAGAANIPLVKGAFVGSKSGNSSSTNSQGSAASASSSSAPSGGGNSSASGYSTASTGSSSSPGSSSGSGGVTGGKGGGPTGGGGTGGSGGGVSIPNCSLNQVATVTCYVPACTPGVTLSPGQKAILALDGTCVVVN